MTGAERAAKTAAWLQHLQAWRESGLKLAAYARQHQLKRWEAYEWRRRLQRQGLWSEAGAANRVSAARQATVRFAPVKVKEPQPTAAARYAPLLVRVSFGNGRCAELQLLDIAQLGEVFAVLERAP